MTIEGCDFSSYGKGKGDESVVQQEQKNEERQLEEEEEEEEECVTAEREDISEDVPVQDDNDEDIDDNVDWDVIDKV